MLNMLIGITWGILTAHADSTVTETARLRWMEGDARGVISTIEPWLDTRTGPYGNERDALRLLLAKAYAEQGEWNLATSQFAIVRSNNRSLSTYARLQEPWSAFQAHQYWSAIKRCKSIRQKYSGRDEAIDCLMLIGMSHGELGQIGSSQQFFNQYLAAVPKSPFRESLALLQAEYTYRKTPKKGYSLLYTLYFHHQYPTTDVKIEEILGAPILLTSLDERSWRMNSFIKGNRLQEAWSLYLEIQNKEEHTPEETTWLDNNLRNISWRTRHFDAYIELASKTYAEEATSENAYKIFRAYCKAGQWENAANFGKESLDHFGRVGRWSGAREQIARSQMFAGQYINAAELWGKMWGNDAKFYRGFSFYMAKDYEQAMETLLPLSKRSSGWDAASHYWIGRSLEAKGEDPIVHYDQATALDSSHWYDILVRQRIALLKQDSKETSELDTNTPNSSTEETTLDHIKNIEQTSKTVHQGTWTEAHQKHLPMPKSDQLDTPIPKQIATTQYTPSLVQQTFEWNTFTTPIRQSVVSSTNAWPSRYSYPDPYAHEVLGTSEELKEVFEWFLGSYGQTFPNLKETQWLVKIGLYPEAARNMQANYIQWEQGRKQTLSPAINKKMRAVDIGMDTWRAIFLYTRTHHYVLRYTTGMEQYFTESQDLNAVAQINHPLVRPADMWGLTEQYNVDPWLMLGLMRQESAYRETVRSWVGAIGYIQVMPATGAKLAFLLGDSGYSPKDLENPETNLRYGIYYFSKLMERFDQAYPLAVGSYNGGPHNMSRWYRDRMGTWEMDEFVEHIPYDETRRYIKKVTGHYDQYVHSYFDDTHQVVIPKAPLKDDPTVIDF